MWWRVKASGVQGHVSITLLPPERHRSSRISGALEFEFPFAFRVGPALLGSIQFLLALLSPQFSAETSSFQSPSLILLLQSLAALLSPMMPAPAVYNYLLQAAWSEWLSTQSCFHCWVCVFFPPKRTRYFSIIVHVPSQPSTMLLCIQGVPVVLQTHYRSYFYCFCRLRNFVSFLRKVLAM